MYLQILIVKIFQCKNQFVYCSVRRPSLPSFRCYSGVTRPARLHLLQYLGGFFQCFFFLSGFVYLAFQSLHLTSMSLNEEECTFVRYIFCGRIVFKCSWFSIRQQFLNSNFKFGFAGLNSVTKGSIFFLYFSFFFNAALLSKLTSARNFSVWLSLYPFSKKRFFEFFNLCSEFTFI